MAVPSKDPYPGNWNEAATDRVCRLLSFGRSRYDPLPTVAPNRPVAVPRLQGDNHASSLEVAAPSGVIALPGETIFAKGVMHTIQNGRSRDAV